MPRTNAVSRPSKTSPLPMAATTTTMHIPPTSQYVDLPAESVPEGQTTLLARTAPMTTIEQLVSGVRMFAIVAIILEQNGCHRRNAGRGRRRAKRRQNDGGMRKHTTVSVAGGVGFVIEECQARAICIARTV
jgi:hypothetical protein